MRVQILKIAAVAALAAAFGAAFGWQRAFAALEEFAKSNANPAAFLLVMGVCCAFAFPVSWCYAFAGAAFGVFGGWCLCLAGIAASSAIGFAAARWLIPAEWAERAAEKARLKGAIRRRLADANFFIRAVPGVPYFMQNIILASIGTEFPKYMLASLATQGPIALAVAFFSNGILEGSASKIAAGMALVAALAAVRRLLASAFGIRAENGSEDGGGAGAGAK